MSEIMLQQTQVPRVLIKYQEFIKRFPTIQDLAGASQTEVLRTWQGLGYNRRGMYLHKSAQILHSVYYGILPKSVELVDELPGVGLATASAIVTYTYNIPTYFIETNVRRVYIHHFFEDEKEVADAQILPILKKTVDQQNPRDWYYALMDYGTHLAKTVPNPNRKSKHYTRQSTFKGSDREIRGTILRMLLNKPEISYDSVSQSLVPLSTDTARINKIVTSLEKEGFIVRERSTIKLVN